MPNASIEIVISDACAFRPRSRIARLFLANGDNLVRKGGEEIAGERGYLFLLLVVELGAAADPNIAVEEVISRNLDFTSAVAKNFLGGVGPPKRYDLVGIETCPGVDGAIDARHQHKLLRQENGDFPKQT